jgi:hypothetical protein
MGAEHDTGPRAEQTFFEDPAIDRVLGVTMALASEVAASAADREAFVAHLMGNLLGQQVSKGAS